MIVGPELEAPRFGADDGAGEGFSDAVTLAFADPRAELFGLARTGIAAGRTASGLAVLFRGLEIAAVRAEGDVAVSGESWGEAAAGGVRGEVLEPLRRWRVTFDGGGVSVGGFALEAEALGEPAVIDPESPVGQVGGMGGYEHLVRVRGRARVDGQELAVDCLGQRGHLWGAPDWDRLALTRTLGAWLGDDLGVTLSAARPARTREHDGEAVVATVLEGDPPAPVPIAEPLLSTTYDAERRQRRAGFELWPDGEEEPARRGAGEALCGTSLDLGRLRLDLAFFRWRMEGREGFGRYDVLRRA